jgi:hypothetical protein
MANTTVATPGTVIAAMPEAGVVWGCLDALKASIRSMAFVIEVEWPTPREIELGNCGTVGRFMRMQSAAHAYLETRLEDALRPGGVVDMDDPMNALYNLSGCFVLLEYCCYSRRGGDSEGLQDDADLMGVMNMLEDAFSVLCDKVSKHVPRPTKAQHREANTSH